MRHLALALALALAFAAQAGLVRGITFTDTTRHEADKADKAAFASSAGQPVVDSYVAEVPVLPGSGVGYSMSGFTLETAFLHEGDSPEQVVLSLCARQQVKRWRKCADTLGRWFGSQAFAHGLDFETPRRYRPGEIRSTDPSTTELVGLVASYGANSTVCHVGSAVSTAALFWLAATDHMAAEGVRVEALEVGDGEFVTDLRSLFRLLFAHRMVEVRHLNHADALRSLPRLECDVVVVDPDVLPARLLDPADVDMFYARWPLDARSFSAAAIDALVGDGDGGIRAHSLIVGCETHGARLVADLVRSGSVVSTSTGNTCTEAAAASR